MRPKQGPALETCQHVQTILREVEQVVLVPGTDMLAHWETELGQAAALLEGIQESIKNGGPAGAMPWAPSQANTSGVPGRVSTTAA